MQVELLPVPEEGDDSMQVEPLPVPEEEDDSMQVEPLPVENNGPGEIVSRLANIFSTKTQYIFTDRYCIA
jgi:hypothetical protein